MQKLRSSSSSILSTSLGSMELEKKPLYRPMHPTRSASRSWKHMDSFLSFVVSHPTVPPAPSERATHLLMLFWLSACIRCCASNARLDSSTNTMVQC